VEVGAGLHRVRIRKPAPLLPASCSAVTPQHGDPNGIDTRHFQDHRSALERHTLRTGLGYADTDYVIGITAVLRPEKNHIQLIEAIARLRRAGLPARGLLIGDGPTRGVVEARARALGVEREVTVTGFREDVRPYLAACAVV